MNHSLKTVNLIDMYVCFDSLTDQLLPHLSLIGLLYLQDMILVINES